MQITQEEFKHHALIFNRRLCFQIWRTYEKSPRDSIGLCSELLNLLEAL